MRGSLRWTAGVVAGLSLQIVFGHWWTIAHADLARLSSPGDCGACFHRPSSNPALLEAVPISVILLIWVSVDAILLLAVELIVVDQWLWRQRASGLVAEAERLTRAAFE